MGQKNFALAKSFLKLLKAQPGLQRRTCNGVSRKTDTRKSTLTRLSTCMCIPLEVFYVFAEEVKFFHACCVRRHHGGHGRTVLTSTRQNMCCYAENPCHAIQYCTIPYHNILTILLPPLPTLFQQPLSR